jgi:hypothetical protein
VRAPGERRWHVVSTGFLAVTLFATLARHPTVLRVLGGFVAELAGSGYLLLSMASRESPPG